MQLSAESEYELVRKAYDRSNPDRENDRKVLWEYLHLAYSRQLSIKIAFSVEKKRLYSTPEDMVKDFFIVQLNPKGKGQGLGNWDGNGSLFALLLYRLRNFLIDKARQYSDISQNQHQENGVIVKTITEKTVRLPEADTYDENSHDLDLNVNLEDVIFKSISLEERTRLVMNAIEALSKINPADAGMLKMEMEGIPRSDIAEKFKTSENAVSQRLNRKNGAIDKLKLIIRKLMDKNY